MSSSAFGLDTRRAIRTPYNPLDVSTIISILPREFTEVKHTIMPGRFTVPAGTLEKPSTLIVRPSSWWKDSGLDQDLIEIPVNSILVADSIITDYCNGLPACTLGSAQPGLMFIPGEWTSEKFLKEKKELLLPLKKKQDAWFQNLIKMADILWARSSGNPLAISDDARMAARELQLASGKSWMGDTNTLALVNCPACGFLRNNAFPVCSNCHTVVDKATYDKLGLGKEPVAKVG